jgi:DNA-binding GntR family transcriptional regulator
VSIDFSDPRPAYLQIADDLRAKIGAQQPPPGERLPSHKAMAQQYGVAVETVKKALAELAGEGLVSTRSTRGTFVLRDRGEVQPSAEYVALMEELKRLSGRMDAMEARLESIEGRRRRGPRDHQVDSPAAQGGASVG